MPGSGLSIFTISGGQRDLASIYESMSYFLPEDMGLTQPLHFEQSDQPHSDSARGDKMWGEGDRHRASVMNAIRQVMLLSAILLLSACAGAPTSPVAEEAGTIEAGYGRAFGRVQFSLDSQALASSASFFDNNLLRLYVQPVPAGQLLDMKIEHDGSFYWPLQAGNYRVVAYQFVRRAGGVVSKITGRVVAEFSVPKPGQAIYIGDVYINARGGRSRTMVIDRYPEALERAKPRLTAGKFQAAAELMRFERDQVANYKGVVDICGPFWAVTCDEIYQGLEPLLPAGTGNRFPTTDALAPVLAWKPAGRPGVSYDVAIYESLSLAEVLPDHRVRGALVTYAEKLQQPMYSPTVPLLAGTKYEWTVRVRDPDTDTVSTWSATSYPWLPLSQPPGRSGRGFGFETPKPRSVEPDPTRQGNIRFHSQGAGTTDRGVTRGWMECGNAPCPKTPPP